ncbi:MAG: PIN domain-containing protein [Chloroflexota bacterium]|nr:PIN domain-containing protein [Chloroflexota bacterium]
MVRQILKEEVGPLIIPAPVTAEVDYLVRERGGPAAGRRFLQDLAMGSFSVEGLTLEEHGLALTLHDRYAGLDLGLADLSVVVLAQRYRTRRLLTFDERDFRPITPLQGGAFTLLPADL